MTVYEVPRHESLQTPDYLSDAQRRRPEKKRMLGVIIPHGATLWFFKLEGPTNDLGARTSEIQEFLKTVRFSPQGDLEWTLPEGWKQLPRSEMRFATLVLNGSTESAPLEMSVSEFPAPTDMPLAEQVLANVNRWRGQLMLPPIDVGDLDTRTTPITVAETPSYWVDISGRPRPRPAQMPPMGGLPPMARNASGGPQFQGQEGWQKFEHQVAKGAFKVEDGGAAVTVTVTSARGNQLMNVNRWRGQVGLEPISEAELTKAGKSVAVGNKRGTEYDLANEGRTILGVIVEDADQSWFVKLDGDSALAERERPKFESFLQSFTWK